MTQRWKKLGLIYRPSGGTEWLHSHATLPIAEHLEGNIYRIYFSSRNKLNQSVTTSLLLDISSNIKILEYPRQPVISPGALGEFDDSGAMASWIVTAKERRYLFYIGWNLGVTVPFRNSIGLAISTGGGAFKRYADGPIIDRSIFEPHFVASCCGLIDDKKWRMWYLSCTGWKIVNGLPTHRYHIKYAESIDGLIWQRCGLVSIDYSNEDEYAISRPTVIRDTNIWRMWYSYRGSSYRIGYAESSDGLTWVRCDNKCNLDVSKSGWDSDMIEYPYVFDHKGVRYMLYNGNGYGATGFGLAILDR